MTCLIVIPTVTGIMEPYLRNQLRHVFKIRQALWARFDSHRYPSKKTTTLALNNTKPYVIVNKNSKTGKVTVVVTKLKFLVVNIALHGTLVSKKC